MVTSIKSSINHWWDYLVLLFGMIAVVSCGNSDEPRFSPKKAPICPEDSIAYMEFYNGLNLSLNTPRPNMVLKPWRFVEFEYDETTRYRYIARIKVYHEEKAPELDSISPSIARLSRLRYLELREMRFNRNFTLPGELFHCPLDTFILTKGFQQNRDMLGITGQLPSDVRMAKETLRYILIRDTGLSELCEELAELTNLEECNLTYNRLSGRVPDYIGDMTGKVDLTRNNYTEYNWRQILEGKNIPDLSLNRIHNEFPPEMKGMVFSEEIMNKFWNQR